MGGKEKRMMENQMEEKRSGRRTKKHSGKGKELVNVIEGWEVRNGYIEDENKEYTHM